MIRKEANTKLNGHLIMDVEDVLAVRKTSDSEVVSHEPGYGKMSTFTKGILEKLSAVQ